MTQKIPSIFLDLVSAAPVAALSPVMPDGQPETTVVWSDCDATCLRFKTIRGSRKEKNMRLIATRITPDAIHR